MSNVKYKISYKCTECGYIGGYGDCEKTNAFLFVSHGSTDTFDLIQIKHINEEDQESKYIIGGSEDVKLDSLIKILSMDEDSNDNEKWNENDFNQLRKARGW